MKRKRGESQTGRWLRTIDSWFPERQLILRTDGRIRYLKVSKAIQVACCGVLLGALGWGGFTSVNYFIIYEIIRGKDQQISNAHSNYRSLLSEVSDYQARFSHLTKELQKNHAMMLDLVETNATLQLNLRDTQGRLESSRQQQVEVVSAKNALRDKLTSIEGELRGLNTRNFELRGNLHVVTKDLQSVVVERNKAIETNVKLQNQVSVLEQEIERLHATEAEIVQRLVKRTRDGIDFMERVFTRAGIKADEFLAELASVPREIEAAARDDEVEPEDNAENEMSSGDSVETETEKSDVEIANVDEQGSEMAETASAGREILAQGGPFFATQPFSESGEKLRASLGNLERQLNRWEDLRQLLRSAPLPAPLESYQISSRFGKRRDPINQRWAMHYGVDLRAPMSSPVLATAPGVVSIAGTEGKYGRLIEIDHGMGFKTRYAHLSKIMVKVGQKVEARAKIGLLGNSGRSTGAHVHYEVSHNGKPIDPMRFIKAGKYVYKGQQQG